MAPTWVVDNDIVEVDHHIGAEPNEHDGSECEPDLAGAAVLPGKEDNQDGACDTHHSPCNGCHYTSE